MRFLSFSLAFTTASLLAACNGTVVQGSGGSATGGSATTSNGTTAVTTGTGMGGAPPTGDCKTDADCAPGTCAALTPGGYLVCLDIPPAATSCTTPKTPMDQCCTSADCTKSGALCYSTQVFGECFGGPAMPIYNECVSDACASDADCAGGTAPRICAPAGAFNHPVRACFPAYCRTSADCTAQPDGACVTVSNPCCAYPAGLACLYPGTCRKDADCGQGNTCQLDPMKGTGQCKSGMAPCPV